MIGGKSEGSYINNLVDHESMEQVCNGYTELAELDQMNRSDLPTKTWTCQVKIFCLHNLVSTWKQGKMKISKFCFDKKIFFTKFSFTQLKIKAESCSHDMQ